MIYLDNAATTPVLPEVRAAMLPFLEAEYGNPSSTHQAGRQVRQAIEAAREHVADWLGCAAAEVVFTSGGTEANVSAIVGAWLANRSAGRTHLVTTAIEHHSVLEPAAFLESLGARVTYVRPQADGVIRIEDVLAAVSTETAVVSVMAVNHELGSIQPVRAIADAVHAQYPGVVVHSDMVQSAATLQLSVHDAHVDLAVVSAHKLHGPKGVGALYVAPGVRWQRVLPGGNQERKRRAGTENVTGIVGFGAAAAARQANLAAHAKQHLDTLYAAFTAGIGNIPDVTVNTPAHGTHAIVNVRFSGVRNDRLLMRLDLAGVAAAAGSACTAGSLEPSHVLLACGQPVAHVLEALRFSFSDQTTVDEVIAGVAIIQREVEFLRQISRTS